MSQDKQFKKLERRAYLSYHQDGLIDIIAGLVLFAFGLNIAFDESIFTVVGWFPILFYVPLKNRITVPRLGYVKFDASLRGSSGKNISFLTLGLLVLALFGVSTFLLGNTSSPPALFVWMRENFTLFFGLLTAFSFGMAGLVSGIRRMYYYALLSLGLMGSAQLLGIDLAAPLIAFSSALILSGGVLLNRFMQKFPETA